MYTREQWILGALQELGVVGAGQSASAEDAKTVSDRIDSLIADLAIRSVWIVGSTDHIDAEAFNHLCILLAQVVAGQFGQQGDESVRLLAEARLRHLKQQDLSGQPQQTDYF